MSRAISSFALLVVACRFDASGPAGDPVAVDSADAGGEVLLDLLLAGPAHYLYDTSTGALTRDGGDAIEVASEVLDGIRVVELGSLFIDAGAELRVTGGLPLAIVAAATVDVAGTIDASSSGEAGDGAGANPDGCLQDDLVLRGGCRGSSDGGGSGGGAIALEARARLAVGGRILVGGAGGAGGTLSAAGGGGGDGGTLWLSAHEILLAQAAVLSANGGGGGEGGDGDDDGRAGEDAPADGRRAHGGAGAANDGGDGGEGAGDMDTAGKPGKEGGGEAGAAGGPGGTGGLVRLSGLVSDEGARVTPR